MKLFDYVFYVAYLFYARWEKPSRFSGAVIIALCQMCNVLSLFLFVLFKMNKKIAINESVFLLFLLGVLFFNEWRYSLDSVYKKIEVDWESKSYYAQQWISFFVVLYIAISVILAVKMAIYAGKSG